MTTTNASPRDAPGSPAGARPSDPLDANGPTAGSRPHGVSGAHGSAAGPRNRRVLDVDGKSASLRALIETLEVPPAGRADIRVRPHPANRELAAFLRALSGEGDAALSLDAPPAGLFPEDPGGPFPFEPVTRMMRPEEKLACAGAMADCVRDGTCLYGPEGERLARSLAVFLGVAHVIPCASGTAALTVALLALGVGQGDEVVIPANSFAATENAVLAVGARPVLADVRAHDHNLDPEAAEAAVTPRTRAMLPVDLHGAPAPMVELRDIANRRGLTLIEDACQAIGSDGVGRHADLATLSFNTIKNFSACGKAGAVLANGPELARKAAMYAYHGFEPGQKMVKRLSHGLNAPMDNIQAAALLARLPHLTLVSLRRLILAMRYNQALSPLARAGALTLPHDRPDHAWHLYTVTLPGPGERQALMDHLAARCLPTKIVYPVLSHRQDTPLVRESFAKAHLPVTERLHETKLCLPLFNGMAIAEQDRVIEAVLEFMRGA